MTIREFYLQRQSSEFPVFKRVLETLPKDHLDYKPDERSPSARDIVWTMTGSMKICVDVVKANKVDRQPSEPPPFDEMMELFERWSAELTERVSAMDEDAWERKAQFYYNGKLVWEQPVGSFLWFVLFDAIHHRGQLTAYLRPMGGKVPSIYGPSADEKPQQTAASR